MNAFNLIDESWIPVVRADGSADQTGIGELLRSPAEFGDLACSSPLEQVAILRLLLAICHRAVPVTSPAEQLERYRGAWPAASLAEYLDAQRPVFDLLDQTRPFMQSPWLASDPDVSAYPIAKIVADWSTGNAKTLFDHQVDEQPRSLSYASSARALVAHQQFAVGGLSKVFRTSAKGGAATGFAHCWVVGDTLQETLVLAQMAVPAPIVATDIPSWEGPAPSKESIVAIHPYPVGPAALYSWCSRSVLLLSDGGEAISAARWAEGRDLDAPAAAMDPMESRRPGAKGQVSFHFSDSKATWRNFHAMTATGGQPAATLANASRMRRMAGLDRRGHVRIAGLLADKAKLVLWRQEDHVLPLDITTDPAKSTSVVQMIRLAEECGQALGKALHLLAKYRLGHPHSNPSPDAVSNLTTSMPGRSVFWSELEPRFSELMAGLAGEDAADDTLKAWTRVCRTALQHGWQQSVDALGSRGVAVAAAGAASRSFGAALALCKVEEVKA